LQSEGIPKEQGITATAKKKALKPKCPYELWFSDGVEFHLLPHLVKKWALRGHQVEVPTPGKNYKVKVYGARRFGKKKFISDIVQFKDKQDNLVKACLRTFKRLKRRSKIIGKLVVIALDNGYPHNTKKVKEFLKQNKRYLKSFWLPRYAPQLNLIEVDWKTIKEKYFSNFLCKGPDELFGRVKFIFKRLGISKVLKSKPHDCIIFRRFPKVFKNLVRYA